MVCDDAPKLVCLAGSFEEECPVAEAERPL